MNLLNILCPPPPRHTRDKPYIEFVKWAVLQVWALGPLEIPLVIRVGLYSYAYAAAEDKMKVRVMHI